MEKKSSERVYSDDAGVVLQYWDCMRRTGFLEPEKYLMLAVLKDALLDYTKSRKGNNLRFQRARNWLFWEHSDRLFSFENICEVLNLNPAFIRSHLDAVRPGHSRAPFNPAAPLIRHKRKEAVMRR